jgi:5-methylcytosine-specific restriction endonuclease McrA
MSWYRRPLAEGQTFRCASCGRVKHVKYVPTSNLCRRCAAKKRRTAPNVPVSLTENLVITTVVEKRLRKKAENDIPKTQAEIIGDRLGNWIVPFFWASGYFVARAISNAIFPSEEWTALFWFVIVVWCFGLPYAGMVIIDRVLARPRNEREEKIKSRVRVLAEERKKKIEEAQLFYSSPEWVKLREQVIKEEGRVCAQCGRKIKNDNDVTVDHIRPRTKYPQLALSRENLRVLCRQCNSRKKDREWLTILQ